MLLIKIYLSRILQLTIIKDVYSPMESSSMRLFYHFMYKYESHCWQSIDCFLFILSMFCFNCIVMYALLSQNILTHADCKCLHSNVLMWPGCCYGYSLSLNSGMMFIRSSKNSPEHLGDRLRSVSLLITFYAACWCWIAKKDVLTFVILQEE